MNYRELCKMYFPHVEIVRDFSEDPSLSSEERADMSQEEILAFEREVQEEFAKSRRNDCYGGSDIAAILGRGFKQNPPSVLAKKKQGKYHEQTSPETQKLFDTGHRAEPLIRDAFERVTGLRTIEWPLQMLCKKHPHFLMNIDGLIFENGQLGIYEGKWSNNFKVVGPHYKKMRELHNAGIKPPLTTAPEKYLFQVWGYMAGLDLNFGYICGGWGYSDDEIGFVRVPRLPKDKEDYMMQVCDEYMDIVNAGGTPSDADVKSKLGLEEIYRAVHATLPDSGKLVNFSSADEVSIKRYLDLQKETRTLEKSLKAQVDEFKNKLYKEKGLNSKKEEMATIATYFEGRMEGESSGIIPGKETTYYLDYQKKKSTRRTFDSKLCKEKYPAIFDEVYRVPDGKKELLVTSSKK